MLPPIGKVRARHCPDRAPAAELGDVDQPARVAVGQRPNQDSVHDAKNRSVGPDAERQRNHGHQCKAPTATQLPQTVAHVCHEFTEQARAECFAALLFVTLIATKLHASLPLRFRTRKPLSFQIVSAVL